jgi:hypothetical protein
MIHGAARERFIIVAILLCAVVSAPLIWHIVRRRRTLIWMAFVTQAAVAVSIQIINDINTGYFAQYGRSAGIANARRVVDFEQAHGFWVEPGWQSYFTQTHHFLLFTLDWNLVSDQMVNFYVFGHALITLFLGVWVWVYRRRFFPLVRNTFFLTNAIAWVVYARFPVAPPRLTPGLTYHGRTYVFRDPLYGVINGSAIPVHARFNEFSAVPSIHIGWSLIVAVTVILLVRPVWIKVLAALYPLVVLTIIVVTGNHYIFDGIAAAGDVALAGSCALLLEAPRKATVAFIKRPFTSPPQPIRSPILRRAGDVRTAAE